MRKALVLLFIVGFCLVVVHAAKTGKGTSSKQGMRRRGPAQVPVSAVLARKGSIEETLELTGEILPARKAEVSPRVSGFLKAVLVRIGDEVSKGHTVIASLDDSDFLCEVQRSEAAVKVVKATVKERQVTLDEALRILKKEKVLFKKKVGSLETLEVTKSKVASAQAALELAQAQVKRSEAELSTSRLKLQRVRVMAPFDGVVAKRHHDGGAQVSSTTKLVTLVNVDRVRVAGEVTEGDYGRLLPFMNYQNPVAARVYVASFAMPLKGTVRAVAPAFDPESRTATVEVELDNADRHLLPGMFARVELVLRKEIDTWLLPVDAFIERNGTRGVFLVEKKGVRFLTLKTGIEGKDFIQVLEGLSSGMQIVTMGNHLVTEKSKITVIEGTKK